MLFYLSFFAGLLLCGAASRNDQLLRSTLYYVCLIGLFLFAGFRYQVGCDWTGYFNIFQLAWHAKPQSEISFWALNRLLHNLDLDYPYINVIAAAAFFVGFHALAKRQPDPFALLILAFPILILELAMSAIRQAMAVGFICFAFNAFVDKRLIRFVAFVLIAVSFHSSAIILLLLTPFVRGEFSMRRIAFGGVLALPGLYYILTSPATETFSQRYIGTATDASGAPFRTGLLAITGIVFLLFLDREWKAQSPPDYKLIKISSYIMVATLPVAIFSSVIGDRVAFYLYPLQLVILARLPLLVAAPYTTLAAMVPYAAATLFLVVWTSFSSLFVRCYVPYQIWW